VHQIARPVGRQFPVLEHPNQGDQSEKVP
jgi:hypothetical protein